VVDLYLKDVVGEPVDKKHVDSSFYLTEEQYGEVMYLKSKHVVRQFKLDYV
jgi:hypothetical protein